MTDNDHTMFHIRDCLLKPLQEEEEEKRFKGKPTWRKNAVFTLKPVERRT